MKKLDFVIIFVIIISYLTLLLNFKKEIFNYRFSYEIIKRYLCSQDIPYEPNCKRVIVSDDEIHIGAGYLYAKGADPAVINFQHMPLIAYLYGFTSIYLKNPYFLEIFFGILYLFLTYFLADKIFGKRIIAILACLFLLIDPLFFDISSQASYELGQAVFAMLYFYSLLFLKNPIIAGIFLGLFATSKYYGAAIFFVLFLNFYLFIKKDFFWKKFFTHLLVAFLVFCLVYIKTFINHKFLFNIFFFQLKLLKYWINHSITNLPFASIILFLTGFFKKWWGDYRFTLINVWSIFWPISFFIEIYLLRDFIKTKKFDYKKIEIKTLVFALPIFYLLYLGSQAPFVRYFVILLPFSYMGLSYFLVKFLINSSKSSS
jgi:predicted membrane-bound dolichyl-phosphate-mannose-protein mannosyltransferase